MRTINKLPFYTLSTAILAAACVADGPIEQSGGTADETTCRTETTWCVDDWRTARCIDGKSALSDCDTSAGYFCRVVAVRQELIASCEQPATLTVCDSGDLVRSASVCDYHNDCRDQSDESVCTSDCEAGDWQPGCGL